MEIKKKVIWILRLFIWPVYLFREVLTEDETGNNYDRLVAGFLSFGLTNLIAGAIIQADFRFKFLIVLKIIVIIHLIIGLIAHLVFKKEFGESFLSQQFNYKKECEK